MYLAHQKEQSEGPVSTSGELSEPVEVILSDSSDTLPFRSSRRRYYVVSLDGVPGAPKESVGSLTRFRAYWNKYCKGVEFHECPGVLTEGRKPGSGVGLTTAYARCLRAALEDGFEQVIFLEDDARDFEQDRTFCEEHGKLFANSPAEALVVLFGAHAFRTRYRGDVDTHTSTDLKLVRVSHSYGTYGFGLPSASEHAKTAQPKKHRCQKTTSGWLDRKVSQRKVTRKTVAHK